MPNDDHTLSKLYYRIGEVAQIVDVDPSVIRHWEREFRALSPRRSRSGQRVFTQKDVEKLLEIKRLRYEAQFTTKGAIKHLRQRGIEPSVEVTTTAAPAPVPVDRSRLRDNLLSLRKRVVDLIAALDNDGVP